MILPSLGPLKFPFLLPCSNEHINRVNFLSSLFSFIAKLLEKVISTHSLQFLIFHSPESTVADFDPYYFTETVLVKGNNTSRSKIQWLNLSSLFVLAGVEISLLSTLIYLVDKL